MDFQRDLGNREALVDAQKSGCFSGYRFHSLFDTLKTMILEKFFLCRKRYPVSDPILSDLFEFHHRFQILQITGNWRKLKNPISYEQLPAVVHKYRYDGKAETYITYWEGLFHRDASDSSDVSSVASEDDV